MSSPSSEGPEPTEFDLGCFFHGFEGEWNETSEQRPFKFCFECGHIFWTEEQMLTEFNDDIKRMELAYFTDGVSLPLAKSAEEIFFCCWCAHDF